MVSGSAKRDASALSAPHRYADHHEDSARRLDDHHGDAERTHELETECMRDLRRVLKCREDPGADAEERRPELELV